ncbi:MAG TPA: response regulator transcription factor [Povalibacter sp.]|nr:response regulator transcription factor [Povalibacter sp.]
MNATVRDHPAMSGLAVAVIATEHRATGLRERVLRTGHRLVEVEDAQLIVTDDATPISDKPILLLGSHDSGSANWLHDECTTEQFDAALRAIAVGLTVRSNAGRLFDALAEHDPPALLTPREFEVLDAISAGHGNKAIARDLGISLHTVKFHIESLFRKLGVRTRAEAVARGFDRRRETIEL